jgi:hypothetical protein
MGRTSRRGRLGGQGVLLATLLMLPDEKTQEGH